MPLKMVSKPFSSSKKTPSRPPPLPSSSHKTPSSTFSRKRALSSSSEDEQGDEDWKTPKSRYSAASTSVRYDHEESEEERPKSKARSNVKATPSNAKATPSNAKATPSNVQAAAKGKSASKMVMSSEEERKKVVSSVKGKTPSSTKGKTIMPPSSEDEDDEDDEPTRMEMDSEEDDEDSDEDSEEQTKGTFMDSESDDDDEDDSNSDDAPDAGEFDTKKSKFKLTHMGEEVQDDYEGADDESDGEEEESEDDEESRKEKLAVLQDTEDPKERAARIKELSLALADFKAFKQKTRSDLSRSQMIERLSAECAAYYGYLPELIDLFLTLFGPAEMVEFLEANEVPRPLSIRANTLKTSRRTLAKALTARGVGLEPVGEWTNVGLKVFESQIPIGATPEYLAGHYMIQSPSSFTPVMALAPRPGEKVLDMCSAPGGKTSHIAQLMRNEGLLVANDAKLPRIDALAANLARMGVKIAAVTHQDGRDFPKVLGGFDRVLLDAPCSGLGVISHDPAVKQLRTIEDIMKTAQLQRELLLAAIDATDFKSEHGGVIVYSTCSISVQENEQIVQYALDKRDVVIEDCGFEFGRPGLTHWQGKTFHPSMKLAKRLYPHTHNMDGFFVCRLKKRSNAILESGKPIVAAEKIDKKSNGKDGDDSDDSSDNGGETKIKKTKRQERAEEKKKYMKSLTRPGKGTREGKSPRQGGGGGSAGGKSPLKGGKVQNGGGGGGKPSFKGGKSPKKKARKE